MQEATFLTRQIKGKRRLSKGDKTYYIINGLILGILALIILYPMYFLVIASFSDPDLIMAGEVILIPKGITFKGYERLFSDNAIWRSYLNTIFYTITSTAISLVITLPAGWAFSRKNMPFKKILLALFIFTMFFGGGLIPFYNIVSKLKLKNTPLAIILPSALSVWNVFMCRAFFSSSIPDEMIEAAEVDGAGHLRVFMTIVLPVSSAIIAVMALYYAVAQWNSYFNALIFITTKEQWFPLQLVLRNILITEEGNASAGSSETIVEQLKLANQIKYTSIIVSSLPIMCLYPFVQKYFAAGIMVGSLKS